MRLFPKHMEREREPRDPYESISREEHTVGESLGRLTAGMSRPVLGGWMVPANPGEPAEEWERAKLEAEDIDREQAREMDRKAE